MRQIRPGVFVDEPLAGDWKLELKLGLDIPLPTVILVNNQIYVKKESRENNQHS